MLSFIAPILLATTAFALPSGTKAPTKPTCMEVGGKVHEWTVENFDYHASYIFSTPAHQNSWGYVNFTLSNPALDYKPVCTAASSQLEDFFYGTVDYECEIPKKHRGDAAKFTFDRPSGKLEIEQSWACTKEGGRFTAEGGKKLKLDCKTKNWQNPNWKIGEIYSKRDVTCKKVTTKVPVERLSAVL